MIVGIVPVQVGLRIVAVEVAVRDIGIGFFDSAVFRSFFNPWVKD